LPIKNFLIVPAHKIAKSNPRIVQQTIITPIKMKVDILARKLVVSIDDDSSADVIGCFSKPINLLRSKDLMKKPMITLGFTILQLMSPRNWSRYISVLEGIGIVKIVKKVQSWILKKVAPIPALFFLANI
jgi:hypothetical protein